ncbi:MAG: ABC transporter ATP-binding protein [Planctomycetota bacterium]
MKLSCGIFQGIDMLELIDVGKEYRSPTGGATAEVLKGVCLKINQGDTISVVGPSGSGKSTLLNIIGGLDQPSRGKVVFQGRYLAVLDDKELACIRNTQIGFVFQLHHLLPQCTVLENVLVPTLVRRNGGLSAQFEKRAFELLKRVGLHEMIDYRPGQLSVGQRQRVVVARALINTPKLLLADEPTGSLDRDTAESIFDLLMGLNQAENVALIVVTHSMSLAKRTGSVLQLKDGLLSSGAEDE